MSFFLTNRTIRFSDEMGLPLEEIQEFSTEDAVPTGLLSSPRGVEGYDTAIEHGIF